ncbi:MAG: SpoIIE family protein phosphatase [Bacteroidales bacterium]
MKRLIAFLILIFFVFRLAAQINKYGTPITWSYKMQDIEAAEYNWCITKDKFGAVYFGNDDNMVIRYDGRTWSKIPIGKNKPTIVRALGTDNRGIVYVGGPDEFGYIEPDSSGNRVYVSVSQKLNSTNVSNVTATGDSLATKKTKDSDFVIGDIFSLIVKDTKVYFLSSRTLSIYNSINSSVSYINLRNLGFRQSIRLYSINDKILLADNIKGLFEIRNGQIVQLPGGEFFRYKMCLAILAYEKDQLIVATHENGVYRYNYTDGSIDSSFIEKTAVRKLIETKIYCGLRLQTGEIIFGTLRDGVFVLNSMGRLIGHWTSQNTEMQDNTVTALNAGTTGDNELWLSTDGYVSKAYVNLPFTQFSLKSGIDGGVNSFCFFNGSVYVATDKGIYNSIVNDDGSRSFNQVNNIIDQVFPLVVGTVKKNKFLLAGSNKGVYQINSNGSYFILKDDRIITDKKLLKKEFTASSILQSKVNSSRFYFGLNTGRIRTLEYKDGFWKELVTINGMKGNILFMQELKNGDLIVMQHFPDAIFRIPFNDTIPLKYSLNKGLPEISLNYLSEIDNELYAGTGSGIYKYDKRNDSWKAEDDMTEGFTKNKNISSFYKDPFGDIWATMFKERYNDVLFSRNNDSLVKFIGGPLNIMPNVKLQYVSSIEGLNWLAKSKSIFVVDKVKLKSKPLAVYTLLTKVIISSRGIDSLVMSGTFFITDEKYRRYPVNTNLDSKLPEFNYNFNSTSFYWTTPYFIEEEKTLYSYKLDGYDKDWSKWDKISYKDYTNLPFGRYTFRIKAKTATEIESMEATFSFIILRPWYLTPLMIILYTIATFLLLFAIIVAYTRRLKNENIRLEGIVAERTAVVVKQKEELESSIHYARRIQMALLPSEAIFSKNIRNFFVLFKPRDIVSGDFYWMTKKGERLYIVAADCTGHGVPGAFMSLLGMSFLDEIIDKDLAPRADVILSELRHHVTESLKQIGGDNEAKDGMDLALLVIDYSVQRIEFSGAYNPCFRVRKLTNEETKNWQDNSIEIPEGSVSNGKFLLETIYASKMPIGISLRMDEKFTFYEWALEKGVSYYLFSDGYIDQFGGPKGRKFMKKSFKRLILDIQDHPMKSQKELLDNNLKEWMGEYPQVDDILVMGIRIE